MGDECSVGQGSEGNRDGRAGSNGSSTSTNNPTSKCVYACEMHRDEYKRKNLKAEGCRGRSAIRPQRPCIKLLPAHDAVSEEATAHRKGLQARQRTLVSSATKPLRSTGSATT